MHKQPPLKPEFKKTWEDQQNKDVFLQDSKIVIYSKTTKLMMKVISSIFHL